MTKTQKEKEKTIDSKSEDSFSFFSSTWFIKYWRLFSKIVQLSQSKRSTSILSFHHHFKKLSTKILKTLHRHLVCQEKLIALAHFQCQLMFRSNSEISKSFWSFRITFLTWTESLLRELKVKAFTIYAEFLERRMNLSKHLDNFCSFSRVMLNSIS